MQNTIRKSFRSFVGHDHDDIDDHDNPRLSVIDTESAQTMIKGGLDRFYKKYKHLVKAAKHQMPSTEVRFENLVFEADVPISKYRNETVGSKFINMANLGRNKTFRKAILNNLNGVIKPGTITLVSY